MHIKQDLGTCETSWLLWGGLIIRYCNSSCCTSLGHHQLTERSLIIQLLILGTISWLGSLKDVQRWSQLMRNVWGNGSQNYVSSVWVFHALLISGVCVCVFSEERLAQLTMELETTRVNALEANSNNEASNLSFEMSEADMWVQRAGGWACSYLRRSQWHLKGKCLVKFLPLWYMYSGTPSMWTLLGGVLISGQYVGHIKVFLHFR